jgi:hypothetical protein
LTKYVTRTPVSFANLVVQRQRQKVAVPGEAAQLATPGQGHPRREHRRRGGSRGGLRYPRLRADRASRKSDAGKRRHRQARKEVTPV